MDSISNSEGMNGMKHQLTTFPNGLRVLSFPMAGRESVSLGVWVACGGRYENIAKAGLSHFIEHMVFKGTKRFTGLQIKKAIEGAGGHLNAFTAEEFTCYLAKVTPRHLGRALEVLSEMVVSPTLTSKDFEKEKPVIIEEIKLYLDLPGSHVIDILFSLLWPNQSLGMFLAGTPQTVSDITHGELKKFKETHYASSNVCVVACGNVSHQQLIKAVKSGFKELKTEKKNTFKKASAGGQKKAQVKILEKKLEQTHLAIGFRASGRRSQKRFPESILNIILGANMSSRLFQEVREKRSLAYEIGSHIKRYDEVGALIIDAGMDNNKREEVLRVILGELKKLTKKGPSPNELKRAKEFFRGQFMLSLESTTERMIWLGENLTTLNKVEDEQAILRKIDSVSFQDVKNTAAQIFKNDNLNLSVIGPLKTNEQKKIKECLKI